MGEMFAAVNSEKIPKKKANAVAAGQPAAQLAVEPTAKQAEKLAVMPAVKPTPQAAFQPNVHRQYTEKL